MIVLVGESSVDDFQKEVMLRAFRNFLRRAKHCRNKGGSASFDLGGMTRVVFDHNFFSGQFKNRPTDDRCKR
jgi:hypothetical protein